MTSSPRESISVFDIFKIGVGPSSSHTLGPWRAAEMFAGRCNELGQVQSIVIHLFGSLAKTGVGHATDVALMLGLMGWDPTTCDTAEIPGVIAEIRATKLIRLASGQSVSFDPDECIQFHRDQALPFHPNALTIVAAAATSELEETYFSIGGGFVVQEARAAQTISVSLPYPIETGAELLAYCASTTESIPAIVRMNERTWREDHEIDSGLLRIWATMLDCIYRGCTTEGVLPGGLGVVRRAAKLNRTMLRDAIWSDRDSWLAALTAHRSGFDETLRWVSCFALAVNEENANLGRVVTAPTNGAAGVIPAVLCYLVAAHGVTDRQVVDFLLTSGEIGSLFKKGSTLSAAMGGCQAEIGVSSAMAAAGLCQVLGGTSCQVLMAAEIAMEHHLGLTCDPVGGLVQVPCIERNAMGAVKAITAANIALASDPENARVSLDQVISTMWQTALDMNWKYKETSEGGLAIQIPVNVAEC